MIVFCVLEFSKSYTVFVVAYFLGGEVLCSVMVTCQLRFVLPLWDFCDRIPCGCSCVDRACPLLAVQVSTISTRAAIAGTSVVEAAEQDSLHRPSTFG